MPSDECENRAPNGVQKPFPAKDPLVALCHAQILSSIGAHLVSPFVGNRPENLFSD